jgi:hypothetical protein
LAPPPAHVCAAGAAAAGMPKGSGADAGSAGEAAGGGAEGVHVDWFQMYHWWLVASCP